MAPLLSDLPASSIVTSPPQSFGFQTSTIDLKIQRHLGHHLQVAYESLCREPLPERFRSLVEQLERALAERGSTVTAFKDGIMEVLPGLRAYAISLVRNTEQADDLVQETILRAWHKQHSFQPGTNLNAWLFTILRNQFHSQYRKKRREIEDVDGTYASQLKSAPEQIHKLEMHDLSAALQRLPADQREALLLVAAEGLSYEEAAEICGTAVGTIKSRVNRARTRLAELMGYTKGDLGSDTIMQSALSGGG
jgi:RNA polymerase sigma-70 factor, ECF subfamily